MNDYLERLKSLQPSQVEGQRLEDIDQWPARQRCVFRECQFPRLHLQAEQLSELRFENCSFGEIYIEGGKLDRVIFDRCKIQGLQLRGGTFSNVSWHQCELGPWTASQSTLKDLQIINSQMQAMVFSEVLGRHCSWVDSKFDRLSVQRGQWLDLTLASTRAAHVELMGVHLERLLWGRCQIELATLADCIAQTATWFDCQLDMLQMSNVQISNASWQNSHVAGGRLDRCVMPTALLAGCRIQGVDMSGCELAQAILDGAHVEDCDLRGVRARRISLRGALLKNVDLSGADLMGLNATGAEVRGLRLAGAICCDGVLHGQRESDWAAADIDDSEFSADPRLDDSLWWSTTRPGPREGALV